jgi:gas vesicle protein
MSNQDQPMKDKSPSERGGLVALIVLTAAVGVGAALLLAPEEGSMIRRRRSSRREIPLVGVAGLLVGAGLTALFAPETGASTRKRLGGTLSRIKVGAVDRIERLRRAEASPTTEDQPVRSIQELGRDSNNVF